MLLLLPTLVPAVVTVPVVLVLLASVELLQRDQILLTGALNTQDGIKLIANALSDMKAVAIPMLNFTTLTVPMTLVSGKLTQ